ncbi:hypothetical protein LCGC14_0482800 [marine sediment metagenome]|uniref:Uncharacterized protein n=1 Tax=marine sediment metagenome TaxID=412755 RepID=A0A0F9SS13_9ZZZZ
MKKQVFIVNNIKFVAENDKELLESFAALSLNPTIKWIKFDLTDSSPNENKERIPKKEFANLIRTGIHMPIKMGEGFIRDGHEFAVPIGTITGLIEQGDQVKGIAALWSKEFPHEVEILRNMSEAEIKPQISWELLYRDSDIDEEGVTNLRDVALSAATVVNMPAYNGRTSITTMANDNSDASVEEDKQIEENNKMEERVEELKSLLEASKNENTTLTEKVSGLEGQLSDSEGRVKELETSNEELANYKIGVEEENANSAKLESILELLASAGVSLPEDYLEDSEKLASLLSMDLNQIEFLIQDIGIFASLEDNDEGNESGASVRLGSRTKAPNLNSREKDKPSVEKIVKSLKKRAK